MKINLAYLDYTEIGEHVKYSKCLGMVLEEDSGILNLVTMGRSSCRIFMKDGKLRGISTIPYYDEWCDKSNWYMNVYHTLKAILTTEFCIETGSSEEIRLIGCIEAFVLCNTIWMASLDSIIESPLHPSVWGKAVTISISPAASRGKVLGSSRAMRLEVYRGKSQKQLYKEGRRLNRVQFRINRIYTLAENTSLGRAIRLTVKRCKKSYSGPDD